MFKSIFILIMLFITSCSATKKGVVNIKNIYKENFVYEVKAEKLKKENFIVNRESGFCFIFLCSKHIDNNVNDFVYKTIEIANKKGMEGNKLVNINLKRKNYFFLFFSYDFIDVNGYIINDN